MPQALLVATAVVGTAASISASKKAAKAGEKQAALQKKQQEVQAGRSRRAAFREEQIKRAQTLARAEAVGAAQGSGVSGGVSSLQSQLGSGLGYAGTQTALSGLITDAGIQQQSYMARSQTFGSIAGLATQGLGFTDFKIG